MPYNNNNRGAPQGNGRANNRPKNPNNFFGVPGNREGARSPRPYPSQQRELYAASPYAAQQREYYAARKNARRDGGELYNQNRSPGMKSRSAYGRYDRIPPRG